jgi:Transposase IS4
MLALYGKSTEKRNEEHRSGSGYLGQFLGLKRFQQIHRYFTLRDKAVHPPQEDKTFAWPVEPIATTVKQNYRTM